MQTYDLIIVGGGPAGATAALYAQCHGLAALLLDKQCFPRDKVCGDALSGKTVAILHELELFEEVCDLPGAAIARIVFGSPDATVASIDLSRYDLHNALTGRVLPMEGFVIRREVFDDFLFAKARAAAARTLEGFTVRELLREGEQVCGVGGAYRRRYALGISCALGVGVRWFQLDCRPQERVIPPRGPRLDGGSTAVLRGRGGPERSDRIALYR